MASTIEYSTIPNCPGQFFRCDAQRATLSVTSCSRLWQEANSRRRDPCDRLHHCQGCEIGAAHSGVVVVKSNELYGARICSRCHRPSPRLIHGRLCPSCMNREYEVLKGKNGKGTKPIKASASLRRIGIRYAVNGKTICREVDLASDLSELMVYAMTKNPAPVFGFYAKFPTMPIQLSLF